MLGRMLSTPGLYPVDASDTRSRDNQGVCRHCPVSPREQSHSQLRTTELDSPSICPVELTPVRVAGIGFLPALSSIRCLTAASPKLVRLVPPS